MSKPDFSPGLSLDGSFLLNELPEDVLMFLGDNEAHIRDILATMVKYTSCDITVTVHRGDVKGMIVEYEKSF